MSKSLPLLDHRVYTIQVRKMAEFLEIFHRLAMPVQLRHLNPPVFMAVSEVGQLNQFMHVWEYENYADFEKRVAARNADPEWGAYIKATIGLITHQEDRFVKRL
jgi:NIPSNAP